MSTPVRRATLAKHWRQRHIAAGRCPRCGDPWIGTTVKCAECLRVQRLKASGETPRTARMFVAH